MDPRRSSSPSPSPSTLTLTLTLTLHPGLVRSLRCANRDCDELFYWEPHSVERLGRLTTPALAGQDTVDNAERRPSLRGVSEGEGVGEGGGWRVRVRVGGGGGGG